MKIPSLVVVTTLALGLAIASVDAARVQDMELRMKFAMAEVVHYDVVGEYSAPTSIFGRVSLPQKFSGADRTVVKDRFEISFDWSPKQVAVVGRPVFKNFPSAVSPGLFAGACQQPPPLTGSYDHLDIVETKYEVGSLLLTSKRTFPAGSAPMTNENNVCGLHPVAARTETVTHALPVIPGTFLSKVTPAPTNTKVGDEGSSAPNKVIIGDDGKTMVLDDTSRGWKYTYTLKVTK